MPVVTRKIAADAADDIGGARPEIDPPVAVEIHRELAIAAGHELRDAERTGKRTRWRGRIDSLVANQQQEFLQLAAKERRSARIVERQRRQRIERAMLARVAPVVRFDAENGDDDFRWHPEALLRTFELAGVRIPVSHTSLHTRL